MFDTSAIDARPAALPATAPEAAWRYHLLRAASERFGRAITALDAAGRQQVEAQAERTLALETRVLASVEARDVVIPSEHLEQAIASVASRYADTAELTADLDRNGLDLAGLRTALHRELVFDAVLLGIGGRHAPVTETDERLFFELHRERFAIPERRRARHILITINDDYPENRRETARARLEAIAAGLHDRRMGPASGVGDPVPDGHALIQRFSRAAREHSECPTALDGGKLGRVTRGQLYPEIDAALFALAAPAVSGINESPVGFHLVLCEEIEPAATVPFAKARGRIREALEKRRRHDCQREWIATLPSSA